MQVMWLELEVEGCSNGVFWSLNYASSPPKRDQGLHFLLRRVFTSSFYAKKNDSDQHPILVRYPNLLHWNYVGTKPSSWSFAFSRMGWKECIYRGVIKRSIKYSKLATQQHHTLAQRQIHIYEIKYKYNVFMWGQIQVHCRGGRNNRLNEIPASVLECSSFTTLGVELNTGTPESVMCLVRIVGKTRRRCRPVCSFFQTGCANFFLLYAHSRLETLVLASWAIALHQMQIFFS